jgi:hypothetical protein
VPAGASVFYTQPIEINVVRTSPETVKDIADLAPPAALPGRVPWALYAGIPALAMAMALFFLLRRRGAPAADEKPPLPPYEEAMDRLASLSPGALVRQNRARELCFALSEILRRYITRRYLVDAIDMTTTEFLVAVKRVPVTAAQRDWIGLFCEATDMVKFAGAQILESEAETLVGRLKAFLEQTKPRPEPADGKPAPAAAAANPQGAPKGKA